MTTPFLTYEQSGAIVTLTMNAPETRNALTGTSAVDEFVAACARIDALVALLKERGYVAADTKSVSSTVSKIYIEEIAYEAEKRNEISAVQMRHDRQ